MRLIKLAVTSMLAATVCRVIGILTIFALVSPAVLAQFEVARLRGHDQVTGTWTSADIDGDLAVVGVPYDGTSTYSGAAYVFVRVAGNWIEEAKLVPSDPVVGGDFGSSVAIVGNRVYVGAQRNHGNVSQSGAVYAFRRFGAFPFASWTEQAKIVASDAVTGAYFGASLAISGSTLVVGSPQFGYSGTGAAYVFSGTGANWTQVARLDDPPALGYFGASVAVDGGALLIGRVSSSNLPGAGYLYENTSGTWALSAQFQAPNNDDPFFAYSIAVSANAVAIGSPQFNGSLPSFPRSGAVFVRFRQGASWSAPVVVETNPLVDGGTFGTAIAINNDRLAVALPNDGSGGSIFLYSLSNSAVAPIGVLKQPAPSSGLNLSLGRGWPLALSGDLAIVAGAASAVFSMVPPAPVVYCTAKVSSVGCLPAISSTGSASSTAGTPFNINAQLILNNKNGLLFFGVTGRTSFPFQGGTLCVLPPIRRTGAQASGGSSSGSDCSGAFSTDFNAVVQSGVFPDLTAGVLIDAQYWYRDPASPSATGLTNAIEFGIGF